ncbi:DUF350 domain-containing protein [Aquimarina rhabdastrellae]
MQTKLITLAVIELTLAILISILIFYISYTILNRLFFKNTSLREGNTAFTIFTSGIILSIGMILSEIIPSITNIIRLSMTGQHQIHLGTLIQYSGLYLFIGFLFAVLINTAVFFLFSILTRGINEFKDIQQNNISTAILVSSILISITLISKNSISLLISALLPYTENANFLL